DRSSDGGEPAPVAASAPAVAAPAPAPAAAAAAPGEASPLRITYPAEGTLFPPESIAPTFTWQDGPAAGRWDVVVRDDTGRELLTASVDAPRWRPSEDGWQQIKQRSRDRDAEVVITAAHDAGDAARARVHVRTSRDPVGDSLFYREVPLPFLT